MSVSLDDIWSEPLANSPSPPPARLGGGNNRVDDEDEEDYIFRPTKRRRSTLFLEGSDDEPQHAPSKSPANANHSQPDIDSLFDDLDDPPISNPSKSSKPFDLSVLRRDAQARAEREAPSSSLARYAVQSSSPPRDGLDGGSKDDALTSRFADESGANQKRQIPKLDEERLLGKNGLPALVQSCKDFKPKGKGHEVSSMHSCTFRSKRFIDSKPCASAFRPQPFVLTVSILVAQVVPENAVQRYSQSYREAMPYQTHACTYCSFALLNQYLFTLKSALLGWMDEANGTINGKKLAQDEDIDMQSGSENESGNEQRRKRSLPALRQMDAQKLCCGTEGNGETEAERLGDTDRADPYAAEYGMAPGEGVKRSYA